MQKVLYDIIGQPPHHMAQAKRIHLFIPEKVRNTIDPLQFGKAQDLHGLVGEHIMYIHYILLQLLAHIFDRVICEGFPNGWTEQYQSSKVETL